MHEDDWRARANCRTTDPNAMQPETATAEDVEEAKAVCNGCPVNARCLMLALSQPGGAYGVHGGKWFGPDPSSPETMPCQWCGADVTNAAGGRTRQYCGVVCRKAAHRARVAVSA